MVLIQFRVGAEIFFFFTTSGAAVEPNQSHIQCLPEYTVHLTSSRY